MTCAKNYFENILKFVKLVYRLQLLNLFLMQCAYMSVMFGSFFIQSWNWQQIGVSHWCSNVLRGYVTTHCQH